MGLGHKEMAESLYVTFPTGQMQGLAPESVSYCCTTNQHKHSDSHNTHFLAHGSVGQKSGMAWLGFLLKA